MKKETTVIVLGTAHRKRESGKCSPDKRLKEYLYSREIVNMVEAELKEKGYKVIVDFKEEDLPKNMQSPSATLERNRELGMRVNIVNELCKQNGAKNVLYVSMHVNAAGADGKWHSANGWQVCISLNASANSKLLAGCLFDAANKKGLRMRRPTLSQKYWAQNLYVLKNTKCPAVLTESLFQDNQSDVNYLLSEVGKQNIAKLHVEGIIDYINKAI